MAAPQSDDFAAATLDPVWSFVDTSGDCTIDTPGGTADITIGTAGAPHDFWSNNLRAPRLEQEVDDDDLDIAVTVLDIPDDEAAADGVAVGIGIYAMGLDTDPGSSVWVRFNTQSDDPSGGTDRFFAASKASGGGPTTRLNTNLPVIGPPLSLRLARTGDDWAIYTAPDEQNWTQQATFTHAMTVARVGVFMANTGSLTAVPWTCRVDSFTNLLDADGGLGVGSASHAHTAGTPTLTQAHQLAPATGRHAHTADTPALAIVHHLEATPAGHAHTAGSPSLTVGHHLAVAGARHQHATGSPTATQAHQLAPGDATHTHHADSPALTVPSLLVVAPDVHDVGPNPLDTHRPRAGVAMPLDPTTYRAGDELPPLGLHWRDADGPIDFGAGWSFAARVGSVGRAALATCTGSIAGATLEPGDDRSPNVTVHWAEGDLDGLPPGEHAVTVVATRGDDGLAMSVETTIRIAKAVSAAS